MPAIVFIFGGARSGKSAFALKKAAEISGKKLFVATAEALDEEMRERIEKHRNERGKVWDTAEVPLEIRDVLEKRGASYNVILIDCLTLWLSNTIGAHNETVCKPDKVERAIGSFVEELQKMKHSPSRFDKLSYVFIVANEVGAGIVPENRLARFFRDMAGRLNQKVAKVADEVYLVAAGIPLRLKG